MRPHVATETRRLRTRISLCFALLSLSLPRAGFAQEDAAKNTSEPPPPVSSEPPPVAPTPPDAPTNVTPPPAPPPVEPVAKAPRERPRPHRPAKARRFWGKPKKQKTQKKTDHEQVVGSYGIGYLGQYAVPIASAVPIGRIDQSGVSPSDRIIVNRQAVPMIGARRWVSRRLAVDAGVGLWYSGGGSSAELGSASVTIDKQSLFALALQASLPIVMMDSQHLTLFVAPQAKFGWAHSNVSALFEENAPPDARLRGARVDVGVRAGGEVYFGFLGMPRLALEGGVGLNFTAELASATVSNQSLSDLSLGVGATSYGNPWDIFAGFATVAARYYF